MKDNEPWSTMIFRMFHWLVLGLPALLALAAGLGFLLWIFGASATNGSRHAHAWTIGFWALLLYAGAYQVLIMGVLISRIAKWPLTDLLHQVIWFAAIAFALTMAYVAMQFG